MRPLRGQSDAGSDTNRVTAEKNDNAAWANIQ